MTVCLVEDRYKDKENRIENPNGKKYTNRPTDFFTVVQKQFNAERVIFQHMVLEQSNNHRLKNEP